MRLVGQGKRVVCLYTYSTYTTNIPYGCSDWRCLLDRVAFQPLHRIRTVTVTIPEWYVWKSTDPPVPLHVIGVD